MSRPRMIGGSAVGYVMTVSKDLRRCLVTADMSQALSESQAQTGDHAMGLE